MDKETKIQTEATFGIIELEIKYVKRNRFVMNMSCATSIIGMNYIKMRNENCEKLLMDDIFSVWVHFTT